MSIDPIAFGRLLEGLSVQRRAGSDETSISSVCYDSRLARSGSLFVALRGGYTDGHGFLRQARAAGAVATVVEGWSEEVDSFEATAQVPDTRAALASIAAKFYRDPGDSMGLIGVTGTDGKTTTSYMIDSILRSSGLRTGLIGTVAVRIGDEITEHDMRQTTPESLDIQRFLSEMRAASVDWAVLEATSHGLELHRLDSCPFDIAVVTNITLEHLELHGTVENYRRAKARLLEHVQRSSSRSYPRGVVLNWDDEGARSIAGYAGDVPVLWFSTTDDSADLFAGGIDLRADGTRFELRFPDSSRHPVRLRLVGRFNVENALAAAGATFVAGLPPEQIVRGLEGLEAVPGRMVRVDRGQPFSVFVDYAHTPDSLGKILRLVRGMVDGRVIVVSGSAGERDRVKRPLQGAVCTELADLAIFTSEDPRFEDPDQIIIEIACGASEQGKVEGRDYLRIENRSEAVAAAIGNARPGDAVVLAGKGHEGCIIYGSERRPWDEVAEAVRALEMRGFVERSDS